MSIPAVLSTNSYEEKVSEPKTNRRADLSVLPELVERLSEGDLVEDGFGIAVESGQPDVDLLANLVNLLLIHSDGRHLFSQSQIGGNADTS